MRDLLDRLYREHAAGMIAALTRSLGPANLDVVEVTIQDAFTKALEGWPTRGIPDNPPAWLFTVARNGALDVVRRDARFAEKRDAIVHDLQPPERPDRWSAAFDRPDAPAFAWELPDDQLRMMFVACHPALPLESRLALTLRTLCGLTVDDIAAALLARHDAIKKRLVRARRTFRDQGIGFELPGPDVLADRLDDVLRVLYLLFSEGYSSHSGQRQIRVELCDEAMRLVEISIAHPPTRSTRAHALAALMALQASRIPARIDASGELITLAGQDRSRWDRALIGRGLEHLSAASRGDELSDFHLEAGIAACHAVAATFEQTDWQRIAGYYDRLIEQNPSPIVHLNRAIALAHADGAEAGLTALAEVRDDSRLRRFGPLEAAAGAMLADIGDLDQAKQAYERALALAGTDPERRFLARKLAELA